MKPRVLDAMDDALGLVKKSDLGGATALIRKALSGERVAGRRRFPKRPPQSTAKVIPLPPRRPLGETLRALRARPIAAVRSPTPERACAGSRRTILEANL